MAAIIYGIGLDLEVLVLPLSAQQWRNFMMVAKQTVDRMLFSSPVAREHDIASQFRFLSYLLSKFQMGSSY